MDLIQALEKLSLEVRHNLNANQLEDFEQSLGTLLGQISDLNWTESKIDEKWGQSLPRKTKGSLSSTASSSQEDDSDCSSSQQTTVPLIFDLLNREVDSSNLTDSVRKISKILSIGNEIESIYFNICDDDHKQVEHYDKSSNGVQSLCDTFKDLCATCETYIDYLPKMTKYKNYCNYLCDSKTTLPIVHDTNFGSARKKPKHDPAVTNNSTNMYLQHPSKQGSGNVNRVDDAENLGHVCDKESNHIDLDRTNWTDNKIYMTNN